jgi:acyl-CoA synthetase (NDP forming)
MDKHVKFMLEPDAVKLLAKYNILYPKNKFVALGEIDKAAEGIRYPVVMKIVSPDIIHKSDAGCVIANINNIDECKEAYFKIINSAKNHNPGADIKGVLICEQAEEGREVIIGTVVDDIFGPAIMFGLGGIFVEVLRDVTFRICPIDKDEALKMIREIKGYELLKGTRGQAALDIEKLAELISKVSGLAADNDDICEIDLNPVRVYKDNVIVLDARIMKRDMQCL